MNIHTSRSITLRTKRKVVSSMKKQEYLQVLVELNKLKLPGNNAMNVRYNQGVEAAKKLLREFVEEKRR